MIHFFALIPKAKGVSSQEFHDHWRHPHGSMGREALSLRNYVQGHQIHSDLLGSDQSTYEGIALSTFDSIKDAVGFGEDPQYKKYVQPDEPNFVGPGLEWLNTREEVLVSRAIVQDGASYADSLWIHLDRPTSIQLLQFIRPDGNKDWAGKNDIELGKRIGALRHVRNYPLTEVHGDKPSFQGVRQLWWPTISAFEKGIQKDKAAFDKLIGQAGKSLTVLVQAERYLR